MNNIFNKENVIKDFKGMVSDTEALIKATANTGGEKLAEVRTKVEQSLSLVKEKLMDDEYEILAKTKTVLKASDNFVHDNPWRSIGFAASIGVVIGLLIGRR
jgi:ElaB/YqjD/DUF883 family membrane-anchored ribosome-binding protein